MKNKITKILTVLLVFSFIVTLSGASSLTALAATSRSTSRSFAVYNDGSIVANCTANFKYDRTTSTAVSGKINWFNNERYTLLTSSVNRSGNKIRFIIVFKDEVNSINITKDYTAVCTPGGVVSWY